MLTIEDELEPVTELTLRFWQVVYFEAYNILRISFRSEYGDP